MIPANKWLVGITSASLISGAALWEGTKYYAYRDIGGVPTVCQGYTGKGIVFGKKYSPEECHTFLVTELKEHGAGVLECIQKPLNQRQFDAFTLMAYNVGVKGFCASRAVKLFNQGLPTQACDAMAHGPDGKPVWSYVGKDFVQGLYNRRLYERAMCLGEPNA